MLIKHRFKDTNDRTIMEISEDYMAEIEQARIDHPDWTESRVGVQWKITGDPDNTIFEEYGPAIDLQNILRDQNFICEEIETPLLLNEE